MKKQDISPFKRAILLIPLIILGCIVGLISLFAIVKLIIAATIIESFLHSKGIPEYCIIITIILLGFLIEMLLKKIKRCEKESSASYEIRWWHEPVCYIICVFLIESLLKLFNLN